MRIIEKVGAEMKAITIVGAGRIRGSRDGDAFVGWKSFRTRELADEPAVGDMVVEDDRVAKPRVSQTPPKPDQIVVIPSGPKSEAPVVLSKT